MNVDQLMHDAVLRIGEVSGVDGRRIYVLVDKNKNLSDMFLNGDILKNISVNSYIEIRKGYLSIIGRVEGEKIEEDHRPSPSLEDRDYSVKDKRVLTVSLSGYIDASGDFVGGTRELPLIGNEAYIITREKMQLVHNLVRDDGISINIATGDDFDIEFPVDGLFNSHIAIFGNTGSGKSNTLAALYQELVRVLNTRNPDAFRINTRFIIFDFNGEYTKDACIARTKRVYNLSTHAEVSDKIPMETDSLLDVEILAILADATEKTQKPFLKRMLRFYHHVHRKYEKDPESYLKNILRKRIKETLQMSDKVRAFLLIDYFREILPSEDADGEPVDIGNDLDWHNQSHEFKNQDGIFLAQHPNCIQDTFLYRHVDLFSLSESLLERIIVFLYLQLIYDLITNRAQNDHIAPVINRLKSKKHDIDRVFQLGECAEFWEQNIVVVNLDEVNLDMKKTLPLLIARKLYADHKRDGEGKTLTMIIDEAHNILSTESFREAESWKDYRLETFEEIIKEGRKFGVFLTIASQRPNDISPTITSQAHNYFIHRLINQHDLRAIASAVSYIDRVTEESIPTLPTGTCVFSGIASQMPLKINVRPLADACRPRSATRELALVVPPLIPDK